MITKTEEGIPVAIFGEGDILISVAIVDKCIMGKNEIEKAHCLLFTQDMPGEIGRDHPEMIGVKLFDEIPKDLIFVFDKSESIDVLIERLQTVKRYLLGDTTWTEKA